MPKTISESLLICAIAKDEDQYIAEWLNYHLDLGVDKIVVYDNESRNPVSSLVNNQRLSVIPWKTEASAAPQLLAYDNCWRRFGYQYDWMLFIDLDEFLNLRRDQLIYSFLERFKNADGVAINWKIFGSCGLISNDGGGVLRRFKFASGPDFEPNKHVKTMFRPRAISQVGVHAPIFLPTAVLVNPCNLALRFGEIQNDVDYSVAQLNHYFVKSADEFLRKRLRGRADYAHGHVNKYRLEEEFNIYDINDFEDITILKNLDAENNRVRKQGFFNQIAALFERIFQSGRLMERL